MDPTGEPGGVGLVQQLLAVGFDERPLCDAVHGDLLSGPSVGSFGRPEDEVIFVASLRELAPPPWRTRVDECGNRAFVIRPVGMVGRDPARQAPRGSAIRCSTA
jgi:hypothetical protein